MADILAAAERVRLNIGRLIDAHSSLKEESRKLAEENNRLSTLLGEKERALAALEEKNRVLRLTKTVSRSPGDTENNKEIKVKINDLVREVDKCISLLNK